MSRPSNQSLPRMCRSVGCILAELLYRKPLFPGKDYIHQLKLIIKTLGSPSDEDLEFISIAKGRAFIKALPRMQVCTYALSRAARRDCPGEKRPKTGMPT